eukprot:NODE_18238_length_903_cov_3.646907.p1 GENE.NODE_18238_length_903_cov_3.646907~~NODE_18238_length_903_cov_3.646907.p1  ORF type:complete len:227 (+),score=59.24 NODE_18238_length_903_cov_3.646907:52-681(+)
MMQDKLAAMDFTKFKTLNKKHMDLLESLLHEDVPLLLSLVPAEAATTAVTDLSQLGVDASPFAVMKVGGMTEYSMHQQGWFVKPEASDYIAEFEALGPVNGKISGAKAKPKLIESKLPSNVLHKVWTLADFDKDGYLTLEEYALCQHFVKMRLDGQDLPPVLPDQMKPTTAMGVPLASGRTMNADDWNALDSARASTVPVDSARASNAP